MYARPSLLYVCYICMCLHNSYFTFNFLFHQAILLVYLYIFQVRISSQSDTEPHVVLKEGQEAHWEVTVTAISPLRLYLYFPSGCRKNFVYPYKSTQGLRIHSGRHVCSIQTCTIHLFRE